MSYFLIIQSNYLIAPPPPIVRQGLIYVAGLFCFVAVNIWCSSFCYNEVMLVIFSVVILIVVKIFKICVIILRDSYYCYHTTNEGLENVNYDGLKQLIQIIFQQSHKWEGSVWISESVFHFVILHFICYIVIWLKMLWDTQLIQLTW